MNKRTYIYVLIGIAAVFVVDLVFPDHHHVVFKWHTIAGFDIAFGFLGAIVLILFSLGLGEYFLWRPTISISLEQNDVGAGNRAARVKTLLVEEGDWIIKGQSLVVFETDRGLPVVIRAPESGQVSRCFVDPNEVVRVGETVVNLVVAKHAVAHGDKETEGTHA
ncbi:MAG: lipoyl domain-containing protein [Myxococcota bacterium]|nr:lipoyl domain-containing protein [Myxococcota bacterium]